MTTAASSRLPRYSASNLRQNAMTPDRAIRRPDSLSRSAAAAGRCRCRDRFDRCRRAATLVAAEAFRALRIRQHGVDLPTCSVGTVDPDLVLDGIATGRPLLDFRLKTRPDERGGCGHDILG